MDVVKGQKQSKNDFLHCHLLSGIYLKKKLAVYRPVLEGFRWTWSVICHCKQQQHWLRVCKPCQTGRMGRQTGDEELHHDFRPAGCAPFRRCGLAAFVRRWAVLVARRDETFKYIPLDFSVTWLAISKPAFSRAGPSALGIEFHFIFFKNKR